MESSIEPSPETLPLSACRHLSDLDVASVDVAPEGWLDVLDNDWLSLATLFLDLENRLDSFDLPEVPSRDMDKLLSDTLLTD